MAIELKEYIVAFIDLLGFTAMVQHDCERPEQDYRYIEALYTIHLKTKELKKTITGLEITQFSDSVVLAIPYSQENYTKVVDVISNYQYDLLNSGILCRGGVSYGKHFSTEDFLFSNGMIDAYKIESTIASTPRVIISKELIDLVYPASELSTNEHLILESDGLYFINYMKNGNADNSWEAICKSIPDQLSENPSIRSKQIWLIDYYNHQFPESKQKDIHRFVP
jgi:hypothetical protein